MNITKKWTANDVRILKKVFRNNSNNEVGIIMNRTEKSIERKASRLGLKKTKKYLKTLGR